MRLGYFASECGAVEICRETCPVISETMVDCVLRKPSSAVTALEYGEVQQ